MSIHDRSLGWALALTLALTTTAGAQSSSSNTSGGAFGTSQGASSSSAPANDWTFTIYPVLAWVPSGIDINLSLPSIGGGEGSDAGFETDIIDSRFDGAYFGGFAATNNVWRIDGGGVWAAVGGDRPQLPALTVDVDLVYFHVTGGRKIASDLFATAGVRRLALKYDILLANQYRYQRKPGVWDPLIGLGWHTVRNTWEFHGTFEGGGFGVGSDVELGASARLDWRPIPHFGLTGGYQWLYFKVEDDVLSRPFTVKQTVQGPMVGLGLYF